MLVTTVCPQCSTEFLVEPYRIEKVGQTQPNMPCCSRRCSALRRIVPPSQTHGHTKGGKHTKEYEAWWKMIRRCTDETDKRYNRYGGRGITVCRRWINSFENFLADVGYAPDQKHSLGRIANDSNYTPKNVEWQLPEVQANNKSNNRVFSVLGKTLTLKQWAKAYGISYRTLYERIRREWPIEKALLTPIIIKYRNTMRLP